jgi:integrase
MERLNMHLTDMAIASLKPPRSGQKTYFDDGLKGFGIRLSYGGTKTFVLMQGSARQLTTLGRYNPPHFTLAKARSKARALIGAHQSEQRAPQITVQDALDRFMEHYAAKNKKSTVEETERLLRRYLAFNGKLADIKRSQLVQKLDAIEALSERRHFFTAAHTFFRWCRRYDLPNLLEGVEKPPKNPSRARLLTNEEMAVVWEKTHRLGVYGLICRVLIVSGQRLTQIAHLHSSYLDRGKKLIAWPPELMKGREFILPYGDLLHSQLPQGDGLLFTNEEGAPFNSWSDPHKELLDLCRIPHFTRHDFRRFYSSTHSAIGTPPHIRELLLDHAIGSEVSRIYDRYTYMAEKCAAQLAYEEYVVTVLRL